jgi:hypothetical protein
LNLEQSGGDNIVSVDVLRPSLFFYLPFFDRGTLTKPTKSETYQRMLIGSAVLSAARRPKKILERECFGGTAAET